MCPPCTRATPLTGVFPCCWVGERWKHCARAPDSKPTRQQGFCALLAIAVTRSQKQTPSSLPPHSMFLTAVTAMAHSPTVDPKPIKIRQGGTSLLFWSCPKAKSSMYIQAQADQDTRTNAIILSLLNQTGVMHSWEK